MRINPADQDQSAALNNIHSAIRNPKSEIFKEGPHAPIVRHATG